MGETLAILGCGTMGTILAEGLLKAGEFQPEQILVTARRPGRAEELAATYGFTAAPSNRDAADPADIVLIAVKPADVPKVLGDIAKTITRRHLMITIAAGVATSSIESGLPMAGPIVRAMPNVAARVGEAITAIAGGDRTGEPDLERAEAFFSSVGTVLRVPEHALNAVTAISGSGPALFAFFAQAMIQAGEELGLSHADVAQLVSQTMLGTASLLLEGDMTPQQLRKAVTSPGGTTEAALGLLKAAGTDQDVKDAVLSAARKAQELSKK